MITPKPSVYARCRGFAGATIERFKEANLYGALLTRMIIGNVVVDHETVTRTFPEGPRVIDVLCIYEVEYGKIAKAWFKMGERRLHASV